MPTAMDATAFEIHDDADIAAEQDKARTKIRQLVAKVNWPDELRSIETVRLGDRLNRQLEAVVAPLWDTTARRAMKVFGPGGSSPLKLTSSQIRALLLDEAARRVHELLDLDTQRDVAETALNEANHVRNEFFERKKKVLADLEAEERKLTADRDSMRQRLDRVEKHVVERRRREGFDPFAVLDAPPRRHRFNSEAHITPPAVGPTLKDQPITDPPSSEPGVDVGDGFCNTNFSAPAEGEF